MYIISSYNKNTLIFIVITCLFSALSALMENNIILGLFSIAYLVFLSCSPIKNAISGLFTLFPFQANLVVPIIELSIVNIIQLILVLRITVFQAKGLGLTQTLLLIIGICFQLICIILYNPSVMDVMGFFINLIVMYAISIYIKSDKDDNYNLFIISFLVGVLLSGVVSLVQAGGVNVLTGGYIGRFKGLWTNPNVFGSQLNMAIACVLTLFIERKVNVIPAILIISCLMYFGLLSGSRSFIYVLMILLLTFSVFWIRRMGRSRNVVLRVAFALVVLVFAWILTFESIILPIIDKRGAISEGTDITAGRLTNIITIFDYVSTEPLTAVIGMGVGNSWRVVRENTGQMVGGTHNFYLDMIVDTGIIGFLLMIFHILSIFKGYRLKIVTERSLFLLVILVSGFSMTFLRTDYVFSIIPLLLYTGNWYKSS